MTLLHLTDIHGQLNPVYFRPPDTNIGVGAFEGIPPHLVGQTFLDHFGIDNGSMLSYAHTMVDYVNLARSYGKLGGLDRTATLVKAIRANRGDDNVLLLDGGDTWQGLLHIAENQRPGHGRLHETAETRCHGRPLGVLPLAAIVWKKLSKTWAIRSWRAIFLTPSGMSRSLNTPRFMKKGGHKVAVIGQAMPYTPIANPRWMFPEWSFGIRPDVLQTNVNAARKSWC